jgi:hypothetical protein
VQQWLVGLGGFARAADPFGDARRAFSSSQRGCDGAHPDDPETGCGGTMAAYVDGAIWPRWIDLTRGERGIGQEEAAAIRAGGAAKACRILSARAVFAGRESHMQKRGQEQPTDYRSPRSLVCGGPSAIPLSFSDRGLD